MKDNNKNDDKKKSVVITSTTTKVNSTTTQKPISQIADEFANQATPEKPKEQVLPQDSTKNKNNSLRNILISGFLIIGLLIPFPQTAGGEIEIEGSPGVQQAVLRASVNGIVEKVLVQTNQKVKTGQEIIALHSLLLCVGII